MNIITKTIIMSTFSLTALMVSAQEDDVSDPHTQEVRPARPSFVAIDINSDGVIDFDEFSSRPLPKKRQHRIFSKIDKDNNGVISKAELINHKPPKRKERR